MNSDRPPAVVNNWMNLAIWMKHNYTNWTQKEEKFDQKKLYKRNAHASELVSIPTSHSWNDPFLINNPVSFLQICFVINKM